MQVLLLDSEGIETKIISAEEYGALDEAVNLEIAKVAKDIDLQLSAVFAKTEVVLTETKILESEHRKQI